MDSNLASLALLVGAVVVAWFIVRQIIGAITCTVRILVFIVVAVVLLYIVGTVMGWPIVDVIDGFIQ